MKIEQIIDMDKFSEKKALLAHLIENKSHIIVRKKSAVKHADGAPLLMMPSVNKIIKAEDNGILQRTCIINTTNLLDSHKDLHLNNMWNKSLKENKYRTLNKEHKQSFEDIIADGVDLKAYSRQFEWKDLGANYEGLTEALMYDVNISKNVNPYMYEKYLSNKVRNHSVEMFYTKIFLCIDDPQYKEEFADYEKYYPLMANKEDENEGFFFAVKEAKEIGGAAVVRGSNHITPVMEQSKGTLKEQFNNTLDVTKEDIINVFKSFQ